MSTRGWHHTVKARKRVMTTGKCIVLAGGGGTLLVIAGTLLFGLLIGALGCYDTTKPAPPCTVSGADGCYPLVHDERARDGGAR